LCKAKEKRAWSELFLHAALYLHGEQSLPADPDGRYREMPDISGHAAGMTVVRGGAVAGGVSAAAPAVASASLTGRARAHNPACQGVWLRFNTPVKPVGLYFPVHRIPQLIKEVD